MPAKHVLARALIHQLQNQFGFVVAVHVPGSLIVVPNSPKVSPVIPPCRCPPTPSQASELSTPLPPSLIIPSSRSSSVATAAYTLLGMGGARVLVEGKTGAGKTALLSHLLRVGRPLVRSVRMDVHVTIDFLFHTSDLNALKDLPAAFQTRHDR